MTILTVLMRKLLVVAVWIVATLGVTYVANTAVELVDLQVFPQGGRIRVLERAVPAAAATTTVPAAAVTTTVPAAATTVAPPLVMVDSILDGARTGSEYSTRLAAEGSVPHTWEVVGGSLPDGLVLAENGDLAGTPLQSGRYQFVAKATDGTGRTGTAEYSLVVKEFRVISARGGLVTVVVQGDSVAFFSALQAEGFDQAVVVRGGPIVVEVQFLPGAGDDTSWVKCVAGDGVICSQG
jgi:hypothetical protein